MLITNSLPRFQQTLIKTKNQEAKINEEIILTKKVNEKELKFHMKRERGSCSQVIE
jgi:hypothetical protein